MPDNVVHMGIHGGHEVVHIIVRVLLPSSRYNISQNSVHFVPSGKHTVDGYHYVSRWVKFFHQPRHLPAQ